MVSLTKGGEIQPLGCFVTPKVGFSRLKISIMTKEIDRRAQSQNEQKITSLEIAEISGKRHTDLLRSIRNQEIAWEKINERKFTLVEYKDEKGEKRPMYELSKAESLYISSKFNDEIRAKLVSRWLELELNQYSPKAKALHSTNEIQENTFITKKMGDYTNLVYFTEGVLWAKFYPIVRYIYDDSATINRFMINRIGSEHFKKIKIGKQQEAWFTNIEGFTGLLSYTKKDIPYSKISSIYRDVFGIEKPKNEDNSFTYHYTDREMLDIIAMVNKKTVNKGNLIDKLLDGKK